MNDMKTLVVDNELEKQVQARTAELAQANEQLASSNEQLRAEAELRKRAEEALRERLQFEGLLVEISARLVSLTTEQIDNEIPYALRRLCEVLDIDRSTLWQASDTAPGSFMLTHIHPIPSAGLPERPEIQVLFPWLGQKLLMGEIVAIERLADLPAEAGRDLETFQAYGTKSSLIVPLSTGNGAVTGALTFGLLREERHWPGIVVKTLHLVAEIFANALARTRADRALRESLLEIEGLKQRLERENIYLQKEVKLLVDHNIVGQSAAMKTVLAQAEQVAPTDSTVIILGETGTGKELLARAIHNMSKRKSRPLVTVNCASLPPTLIESELFGREKGAYTGALTRMVGRFEVADGSTLFLDEIGELPFDLQSKLLRVLEEGVFERLGSTRPIRVNIRLIAATNRDLADDVKKERFRKDLYYRLNVFPIVIPPLRERREDIPLMVWTFVNEFQQKMGKRIDSVHRKSMEALQSYAWPGNGRELRNVIERAMILSHTESLEVTLPGVPGGPGGPEIVAADAHMEQSLEDVERRHILSVLQRTRWRVTGRGSAAEILGLKGSTLQSKMKKLGITRPSN
jgi:formate hydrogenlyase transcriptional activator